MEEVIQKINEKFIEYKNVLLLIKNEDFVKSDLHIIKNNRDCIKIKIPCHDEYKEIYLYRSTGANSSRRNIYLPFFEINFGGVDKMEDDTSNEYHMFRRANRNSLSEMYLSEYEYYVNFCISEFIHIIPSPRFFLNSLFLFISVIFALSDDTYSSFMEEDIEDINDLLRLLNIKLDDLKIFKINYNTEEVSEEYKLNMYNIISNTNNILKPTKILAFDQFGGYCKKYKKYKKKYLSLKFSI